MIIKFNNVVHHCSRAEQHKNDLHLFDENGDLRYVLKNISNVEVEDGEISVIEAPEYSEKERIAALEDSVLEMIGVNMND